MSTSQPHKRRRLGLATANNRPFKSPLKLAPPATNPPTAQDKESAPSSTTTTIPLAGAPLPVAIDPDATLLTLTKHHTSLLNQLMTLRRDLETARQALRVSQSSEDDDLKRLIIEWRRASQEAAEEVFGTAKERVQGMGGMRGMKRERMAMDANYPDDNGSRGTKDEEADVVVGGKEQEMKDEIAQAEVEEQIAEAEDDESFTMSVMLKSLDINLDLIGYDKENQRWRDC